jgi:hypothetical protein
MGTAEESIGDLEVGKFPGGGLFPDLHIVHAGGGSSFTAPSQHRLGGKIFSLEDHLHTTVREIPDPSGQPQRTRLFPGVRPEEDPLDTARDVNMVSFVFHTIDDFAYKSSSQGVKIRR